MSPRETHDEARRPYCGAANRYDFGRLFERLSGLLKVAQLSAPEAPLVGLADASEALGRHEIEMKRMRKP